MGMLPPMLVLITLWVATLVLLVGVAMGPERYIRKIVRNLRPDTAEPTKDGYALLFWRNVLLLLVVGAFVVTRTAEVLGPSDAEPYESAGLVAGLVPADELDDDRLDSELRVLLGDVATVEDVSSDLPEPPEDESLEGSTVTMTYLEVRALTWRERVDDRTDSDGAPAPAACVSIEKTSYSAEVRWNYVSVSQGRCAAD